MSNAELGEITEDEPTPEEVEELGEEEGVDAEPDEAPAEAGGLPDWVVVPEGLKIPPGAEVIAMRFRAEWTAVPKKGERWCLTWPLTEAEESAALKRTRGDLFRSTPEMAKMTIRVIDGVKADWSAKIIGGVVSKGNVNRFWHEIGPKCRKMLVANYHRTHNLNEEQLQDFLLSCQRSLTAELG